jgi:FAD/FMN-containing dehydrogenase
MSARISRRRALRTSAGLAALLATPVGAARHLDGALLIERSSPAFRTYAGCFNARIRKTPAAIALCRNEEGVVSAFAYAKKHTLPVAIKSGGHSFEGFSLNDDGLVIDLSQMRQQRFGKGDATFACGPGWKLGQLYDLLIPRGKLLPAGSCGGVGVAGLTLGGGYGLFAREFGLTCDRLTGIRVVTPAGELLDSDQRPELLWACRGGGNGNFGVVTELRYALVEAPKTLTAHRFKCRGLQPERATRLLKTWMDLERALPHSAFSAYVLNGKTLTILVTTTGDAADVAPCLQQLETICDETRRGRSRALLQAIRPFYGRPGPLPFKNASGGFYDEFTDLEAAAAPLAAATANSSGTIFQVNTLGGKIMTEPDAIGSAYPHRKARFIGEIQAYWDTDRQATTRIQAVTEMQSILTATGINRHYRNYPDLNLKNWSAAYYGNSLSRLQTLTRSLDPDNRVRHPQSI